MGSRGRPVKFKTLEEIYQNADAECIPLRLAERETRQRNDYVDDENEPDKENSIEELTLSQFRKKLKKKKRKASEPVILTPKEEDDDFELTETLCKFKVKVSKSSWSKRVSANTNSSTSSKGAQLATSEIIKDLATVNIKVEEVNNFESNYDLTRGELESSIIEGGKCALNESPEVEYFESNHDLKRGESESSTNEGGKCELNEVPDVEYAESNYDLKRGESDSFTNEGEKCEINEVSFDSVDDTKNKEMDVDKNIANVNEPSSILSSLANDSFLKDTTASASDCSQSQLYLHLASEQVDYIYAVQDSDPTIDDEHSGDVTSMEAKSPISQENTNSTSMNIDADSTSFNSDDISLVSKDIFIHPELSSTVTAANGLEGKLDHNDQTCVMSEASEIRQPERLPLTRKFISPNSQEKLCQAMKSAEPLDDMDHFKCKEKLYFGEQTENKFSSTKSDAEGNEVSTHPQQATELIQNKAVISSKNVLKRPRNCRKVSPTKNGIAPKGSLDGPRLCRSLPRFSTGCTSIEGCSESAIAFSQRQMHDIESLASKLLSELNSMKVIIEEKMLFEAYRSPSLKNEADEVKSAIKSATKTEETAKKWLSMMARDCSRFCKIMKLNEDHNTSASSDPALCIRLNKNHLQNKGWFLGDFAD
ncbi:hypothetical protein QVD17_02320 [Tagetes erecta]|uniref:Uncharacterized protein n=1 Tax=Tagetes erecta TaxID=13708 RepID=A0AAD8L963_TARER|nr:hypothetical protein QVD17_02320 [Tagetes erecta]